MMFEHVLFTVRYLTQNNLYLVCHKGANVLVAANSQGTIKVKFLLCYIDD